MCEQNSNFLMISNLCCCFPQLSWLLSKAIFLFFILECATKHLDTKNDNISSIAGYTAVLIPQVSCCVYLHP
jgi:hypothetical protein